MTEEEWRKKILQISSRLTSRKAAGCEILKNHQLLSYSLRFLESTDNELRTKAAYAIDIALRNDLLILKAYQNQFFKVLKNLKQDTEKRIFSKILESITFDYLNEKSFPLNHEEHEQIIATCFDWLIGEEPVAIKVFAMQSIFNLSESEPWIKTELKAQLELQYETASAAFKSRASKILKKLKTHS